MTILVTGGTGFIGSHTCVELLSAGHKLFVIDNLSNSSANVLDRLKSITGQEIPFKQMDIRDKEELRTLFKTNNFNAVIHFAGLKAVGESCDQPLTYYDNNVAGTLALCEVMSEFNVHELIFSSSATVYGDPACVPITEDFPTQATNPYGRSKLIVEDILRDLVAANASPWKITLLRYFNPIGAHTSGLIGEDPRGIPNNLLPFVAQVASGKLEKLRVFGDNYPTRDGTGVRDYIHVVDLAKGHVKALEKLTTCQPGCHTYNLGTGTGYSVLEIINTFSEISGKPVPYEVVERRPGDIAECFANGNKAKHEIEWTAELGLHDMITDAWRWQTSKDA